MKKKPQKQSLSWTTILLFVLGFGLIGYPIVTQAYSAMHQTSVVNHYNVSSEAFGEAKKTAFENQVAARNSEIREKAAAANNRADQAVIKAMVELNRKRDAETQGSTETGDPIGVLSIPTMGGLRLPIYDGISDAVLSSGAGLIPGTSVPQANATGVSSVLTSHSGLPTAKLFTYLGTMKLKEKFYIEINGHTLTYKVDRIKVVKPANLQRYFTLDPTKNVVTLMTCTPVGVNSHRLLVRGHLVPTDKLPSTGIQTEFYWLGGFVIAVILVGTWLFKKRRKRV